MTSSGGRASPSRPATTRTRPGRSRCCSARSASPPWTGSACTTGSAARGTSCPPPAASTSTCTSSTRGCSGSWTPARRWRTGGRSCTPRWASTVSTSCPSRTGCRPADRAEFFRRTAEMFHAHRPPGARIPADLRVLEGSYAGYVLRRRATRTGREIQRRARQARGRRRRRGRCAPGRCCAARWTPTSRCTRRSRTAGCSATPRPSTARPVNSPRTSGACGWSPTRSGPRPCRRAPRTCCPARPSTAG